MKLKIPSIKQKRSIPDLLKGRENLTKDEFCKKYFADDEKLKKIAVELLEHLEKTYNIDLSGLRPDDRLCDIIGEPIEKNERHDEYETVSSMVKKAVNLYIDYRPFEKYFKHSKWDKTTIRYRSFDGLVREISKYRND